MVVNVLDADARKVEALRKSMVAANSYGKASVEQWTEPELPYADNLVSLLVVTDAGKTPAMGGLG